MVVFLICTVIGILGTLGGFLFGVLTMTGLGNHVSTNLVSSQAYIKSPNGTILGVIRFFPEGKVVFKYSWGPRAGESTIIDPTDIFNKYWFQYRDLDVSEAKSAPKKGEVVPFKVIEGGDIDGDK